MEVSEENLLALSNYLQQSMSPDMNQRKPAEDFLRSVESQQGFPILVLTLLGPDRPTDAAIKIAGAIAFKNFIKRNWKVIAVFYYA